MPGQMEELGAKAVEAMSRAYCPYSKFNVGAALLCKDGTIVTGCNVENAAYGGTICAERTAVVKAVSEGHREFTAIAVTTYTRMQFMFEFGTFDVYMFSPDLKKCKKLTTAELLPMGFDVSCLERVAGKQP